MLLVRHAAAAINEGLCETVLITHGESGRSNLGRHGSSIFPSLFQQQFERPFGVTRPPTMFTIPDNASCYINFSSIEPILNNNCVGCHGSSGGVNLESYSNTVNSFLISKSDSSRSLLYQVISKQSGYYMPPSVSLSDDEIRKIALWIQFGAKEIN